jgi:hypothetical protein
MINKVLEVFAKFYNSLHPKLKIGVMVTISFVASGVTNLLIRDVTDYNASVTNEYIKLAFDGLLILLGVVYNILQQSAVELGTQKLVADKDEKTIAKLHTKIADTKKLLS